MDNRTFGYARVSTREQNEDRQIESLTAFGVSKDNIIVDKCSGKDTNREGYQYLKKQILRSGDTLVIKELDRLSRNKSDIKHELEYFNNLGVRVKILDIPTTLTEFPDEQMWVMDMINAILIEVLGSIAENERNKIRNRQREGIAAAKKKNVRFGRPAVNKPENWEADNIQYGISCIQSAICQRIAGSYPPLPTPVEELVVNGGEFVVMVSV